MEKRLAIAIVLCVGFMVLWGWLFPAPKPPQTPAAPVPVQGQSVVAEAAPVDQSPAGATSSPAASPAAPAALTGTDAPAASRANILPAAATAATAEEIIAVDLPLLSVRMSNRGAHITSWKLPRYNDTKGAPLDLVSPIDPKLDRFPLDLHLEDQAASQKLREALYRVDRQERDDQGRKVIVLTFSWNDGQGNAAAKTLTFTGDSYVAELEVAAEIAGRPVTPAIEWGAGFEDDAVTASERMSVGTRAVVNIDGRIEHHYDVTVKPEAPWSASGSIAWAGMESKYFAAILVPQAATVTPSRARVESLRLVEDGREQMHLDFALLAPSAGRFHLFVGPKDYDILKGLGLGLDRLLNFGVFSLIAVPLFAALKFIQHYTGNYGWAIVLLTIGIRMVFFPFMHRSQLKMRVMQEKMKRIQPKLKALKERYHKLERKEAEKGKAGSRQRVRQQQNEEMMDLYKEEGINPFSSMSGCLPLLVQMPILYAFYSILTISIELRHAPFMLWVHDLSVMDPYFVTPILMGASMLAQQVMTSSAIADVGQRRMMYFMPIMFTWFFIKLPSGLVLYWLVNNLLGIVQQYLVNKEADARKQSEAEAAA